MRGGPLSTRSLHALAGLYPLHESSQAADLTVTSYQSETSVDEELHHKRDHMPVMLHSQKLHMKTTFPTSTVGRSKVYESYANVLGLWSKPASILSVGSVTWSVVDGPCLKPACSGVCCGSITGSSFKRSRRSISFRGTHSNDIGR